VPMRRKTVMSSYICEHTNELGTRVVARVGGATLERRHGTPILQTLDRHASFK
jgi:hypothetical protein